MDCKRFTKTELLSEKNDSNKYFSELINSYRLIHHQLGH